ncbi:biotin-dependent carboxyltransferase family protein [Fertoebacter nigrum]|uniref:Biotin-dependent carboxyltransferase family protein n=1 Tax=Fertoeibacter niger TaxID=2656921 RepID=A0A8X8KP25_9RHOB|nr:biotin-dependent carboxyltransferase family protein [Fertoeibacter niger]NUB45620.1 biotin-dependent carboxyltransferase family protein [Fertoeibacter niger]
MAGALFRILHAGPQVSVQDGGRRGLMRYGVPASGPMDRAALAIANTALGNPADAPGIEVSRGGLTLECLSGSVGFAVAGGGFILEAGGARQGSWQVAAISAGQRLSLRPGPWGSWTYLAFAGKLEVPDWLGSAATHALSGLGGGMLATGGQIALATAERRAEREGPIPCPVSARPRHRLHVVIGPQERFFGGDTLTTFLTRPFHVTDAADRMGVRLRGPTLAPDATLDMPSEPVLRGSVQVAGDGVATVLLADHQTTGGYPKIATILSADLDGFVQLRPQDTVWFHAIGPEAAVALARRRQRSHAEYLGRLALRQPLMPAFRPS